MSGHRLAPWMVVLSGALPAHGGVYLGTVACPGTTACAPLHPASNGAVIINPYGITHPATFQDSGGLGLPNVRVCVNEAFSGNLSPIVAWAVGKWNALEPVVNNCARCEIVEIGGGPPPINLASTVLHELGHCALGLQHQGVVIDADGIPGREETSYTMSYGGAAAFFDDGPDNVRGSRDDDQPAGGGGIAEVVFWFRKANNDPINQVLPKFIDGSTYSRAFADFPVGTFYPANANHGVAGLLGQSATQSVMWSRGNDAVFFDLSPDDVSMVQMARTGIDRFIQDPPPPAPGDDYAILLEVGPCSDPHELTISAASLGPTGPKGRCTFSIDFSAPNPPSPGVANSYKLVSGAQIEVNTDLNFEFAIPLFYGSFESNDFTGWDGVEPPP